jgi:hypothetical protein
MDVTPSNTPLRSFPWLNGAFGVVVVVICILAWIRSGQLGYFLTAVGFGALTPVWHLRPVSFVAPVGREFKRPREPLPPWAKGLTFSGFALIALGIWVRWAT